MRRSAGSRALTAATLVARLILGLVYAIAAASKITAPGLFRQDVADYRLLPAGLVGPFAYALPWIEAVIALYLLIGLFLRPTAIVTILTLLLFVVALADSLARGATSHGCGCLPTSGLLGSLPFVTWLAGGATITIFDVARDAVFMGLAVLVYVGDRATLSLDGLLFGSGPMLEDIPSPAEPAGQAPPSSATLEETVKGRNVT